LYFKKEFFLKKVFFVKKVSFVKKDVFLSKKFLSSKKVPFVKKVSFVKNTKNIYYNYFVKTIFFVLFDLTFCRMFFFIFVLFYDKSQLWSKGICENVCIISSECLKHSPAVLENYPKKCNFFSTFLFKVDRQNDFFENLRYKNWRTFEFLNY